MIKKSKNYKVLALTLVLTMCTGLVLAVAITEDLHVNIQSTYANGSIENGTFAFVFNISTTSDCADANIVYSNSSTLETDSRGIISYYLPNVTLDYDQQYWLCHYRDSVLKASSKIVRSPYAFTARNISAEGISNDSNLDLTNYNITADTGFLNLAWSYLTGLPDLIRGIWTANNVNSLLISNGTYIGYNQTILNESINASIDVRAVTSEVDPYWGLNYSDYLVIQSYALNDSLWSLNYSDYLANYSDNLVTRAYALNDSLWSLNYSDFLVIQAYSLNDSLWSLNYSSYLANYSNNIVTRAYALNDSLWSLNYSDYLAIQNYALNDSLWSLNYSDFLVIQAYSLNDSLWSLNYSSYLANYSDNLVTRAYALNDSLWSLNYSDYLAIQNYALNDSLWSLNYSDFLVIQSYALNDSLWSLNYSSYLANYSDNLVTRAYALNDSLWSLNYSDFLVIQAYSLNDSLWSLNYSDFLVIYSYVDNETYVKRSGDTMTGDFDFNGGIGTGVSIRGGSIYAQTGYFYNISSLQVDNMEINGSLYPDVTDSFDLGNGTFKWKGLYLSGDANVDGTVYSGGDAVLTVETLWNANYSAYLVTDAYALNDSLWSLNYSDFLVIQSYALNDSLWSLNYSTFLTHLDWGDAMNGTLATWVQAVNGTLADNTTIAAYIDAMDTLENTTMKAYVDAMDTLENSTMKAYVDAMDTSENTTMKAYVDALNVSQGSWVGDNYVPYTGADKNIVLGNNNLSVGGTDFFVDNNLGLVGIGTSSPGAPLHITGMGYQTTKSLKLEGATYSTITFINQDADADARNWGIYAPHTDHGTFEIRSGNAQGDDPQTSGTTRLTILNDGNVGIGTSSPGELLTLTDDTNGAILLFDGVITAGADQIQNELQFSLDGTTPNAKIVSVQTDTDNDKVGLAFYTHPSATRSTAAVEKMRITAAGNVGIGTSSPLDALHIQSAVTSAHRGNLFLADSSAIAAGTGGKITFGGIYSGSTYTEWAGIQGTKAVATGGNYGGELEFRTRTHGSPMDTKMIIDTSGNVGIGTSSPQNTLNVVGDINATGKLYAGSTSMPSFSVYQQDAGQTGILTSTYTKVIWHTEDWDTHSDFASSRFTPSVAGKYLLTGTVWLEAGDIDNGEQLELLIYKNGAKHKAASMKFAGTGNFQSPTLSVIVDANGDTDYFEMYLWQSTGVTKNTVTSGEVSAVSIKTYFQGVGIL